MKCDSLHQILAMDTGNCPTEGLKSELNKLRLVLCNAESTLTKAEEKIDRVDVLEVCNDASVDRLFQAFVPDTI